MTEPNFDETDETEAVETPTEDVPEVDTPEALDDEETDAPAETTTTEKAAAPKAEKKPARPAVPAGYIAPVEFAKRLTEHLEKQGKSNKNGPITTKSAESAGNPIPPQYIYSMINQSRRESSKNPIPTYVSTKDGQIFKTGEAPEGTKIERENLLVLEEALGWWDAKDRRVAASKAEKAQKEQAKAEKAKAEAEKATVTEVETPAEPVVEAE
jgi:hypothetical protein